MRNFILKTFACSIPVMGFIWLSFWQADGRTDAFYLRYATPKKESLVIGTSRAAQGITPSVLDSCLNRNGTFNYAMTVASSPYGPAYYRSIKNKVSQGSTNGIFILEVSPWSISSMCSDPNDTSSFREQNLAVSKISNVNQKPNIEYLLKSYSNPFYQLWFPEPTGMFLHDDGWLEVSINMDSVKVKKRTDDKISRYTSLINAYQFSEVRFEYFKKTIDTLANYGRVFVVRMPVCPEMEGLENEFMDSFNDKIEELIKTREINYFDFTDKSSEYQFTDGNHLYKDSAKKLSIKLAALISESNPD